MQWFYWLLALIISAGVAYWIYRADRKREIPQPWLTALLRGIVIFLSLLLILAPVITITKNETQKPVVLFLQDNSGSIAPALGKDSTTYKKKAEDLLEKLSDKYRVVRWGFGNTIQNDSIFSFKQQATNISNAMARAQEFYGMQNLGAVILATDGRFNEGTNPLYQQLSLNSPVYTVGIGDSTLQKDLRIARVFSNKTVSLNNQFEIRADIVAALCKGYSNSATLSENGSSIATSSISVNTDRYDRSISFTVKAQSPGLHHYVLNLPVAAGEQNTANNKRDIFVEVVDEKKDILLLAAAPHPDVNAIREALEGTESYKLTVAMAENAPSIQDFDVLILHQLPAINDNVFQELRVAQKPTWYILGGKTNPGLLNQLNKPATLSINPMALRDITATYNSSFNLFTLPATIGSVTDKMPPLGVPMGNITPSANTSILFNQRINNGEQAPLWILQQGAVPTAMTSGEGLWRWRVYEYRYFNNHNVVDECIRQTISFLSVSNNKPFRVELPKYVWSDQEAISLNAYLLNANNEQVNAPEVKLSVTDSNGKEQQLSFERSGNAYRINMGIWAGGSYKYTAQTSYNGKTYSAAGSFVVESMPLEMMETGADYNLLYSLSQKYNGAFFPAANLASLYDTISKNEHIKPVIQTNTDTVPLVDWKWYFFLILLFATAEWLLRKYWLAQ
jgi:hypothetical protein